MDKPVLSKPPAAMTDVEIVAHGTAIREYFREYSESDPFGWDWATMRIVFPELVGDYDLLKAEWLARTRKKERPADDRH